MASTATKREIAFIDRNVDDLHTLLAGIRPDVEAILLSNDESAPRQMARSVQGRQGELHAIHVIAHGRPGEVLFGAGTLSIETIRKHAADLAHLGQALLDGNLFLWSCQTGQGECGEGFVDALASATGVEVAAAAGLIGAAARGGCWAINVRPGATRARMPLTPAGAATYAAVMVDTWQANGSSLGGDWADPSHWSDGSVPSGSVDVTIPSLNPNNAFTVTISSGDKISPISVLVINSNSGTTLNIDSNSLIVDEELDVVNGHITITNGGDIKAGEIKLASGTDLIGEGTVDIINLPTGSISGAGTVGASGGTLAIEGNVTNLGALQVGDSSALILEGASNSATTATFLGSNGSIVLQSPTTLTLTNALSIGANQVNLEGQSSLTDNNGITLAGGVISGTGAISSGTNITGWGTVSMPFNTADTVTASGGILEFTNSVDSSAATTFHIANGSVLEFDGRVGSTATINFDALTNGAGVSVLI